MLAGCYVIRGKGEGMHGVPRMPLESSHRLKLFNQVAVLVWVFLTSRPFQLDWFNIGVDKQTDA